MRLVTDYRQWYDGIFNEAPPVFHRQAFTAGGLTKRRQFALFESLGLRVPRHGTVRELVAQLASASLGFPPPPEALADLRLVVYLDELAHRGEGKQLLPLNEAAAAYPERYGAVFHPPQTTGKAWRLARLGRLSFWLEQQARSGDWRSNRDDSERLLGRCRTDAPNPIPRALWAIDFVVSPDGLLAVDFNTAPDLAILGETGALAPSEVADELAWVSQTHPEQLAQF